MSGELGVRSGESEVRSVSWRCGGCDEVGGMRCAAVVKRSGAHRGGIGGRDELGVGEVRGGGDSAVARSACNNLEKLRKNLI